MKAASLSSCNSQKSNSQKSVGDATSELHSAAVTLALPSTATTAVATAVATAADSFVQAPPECSPEELDELCQAFCEAISRNGKGIMHLRLQPAAQVGSTP